MPLQHLSHVQVNTSWQAGFDDRGVCSGTNVLLYALGRLLMRHSKAQVVGGQAVSQLPPKTEEALAGETLSLHICINSSLNV